jgi:hypothetical protein
VLVTPFRFLSFILSSFLILGPWRWYRQVVPKRREGITTRRCVITQKRAVLISFAAETWSHAKSQLFTKLLQVGNGAYLPNCYKLVTVHVYRIQVPVIQIRSLKNAGIVACHVATLLSWLSQYCNTWKSPCSFLKSNLLMPFRAIITACSAREVSAKLHRGGQIQNDWCGRKGRIELALYCRDVNLTTYIYLAMLKTSELWPYQRTNVTRLSVGILASL